MNHSNRPADRLGRLADFVALREQGLSVRAAGRQLGLSERAAWTYAKAVKAEATQQRLREIVLRPVPEGVEITGVSETSDQFGNLKAQSVRMAPDAMPDEVIPEGHIVKGVSTLVDGNGAVRAQWVKTREDRNSVLLATQAALDGLIARLDNYSLPPAAAPAATVESLATLYTMTDCHVGMLAWPDETHGAPWDLTIAQRVLTDTFCRVVDTAPPSRWGILNQLGDFLHFDSLLAVTPSSGHVLDSDSRYQKVVQAATEILETVISKMLTKHELVQVYMHEGNHDMAGSVWLRILFARLYRDNPRVKVETNPNPYQCFHFGKTMICFHHGHLAKWAKLPSIFAAQYAKTWGATEHRYAHTGHYHEVHEREHPGMIVLQHPTIASPDAYAARNGYMSKRQTLAITYSSELGEVGRSSFLPVE